MKVLTQPLRLDVYCRVIDHLGDIGVCHRLARSLRAETVWEIRLICDQPELARRLADSSLDGAAWEAWPDEQQTVLPLPEVVLSAFGCDLPLQVRDQLRIQSQQSPQSQRSPLDPNRQCLWIHLDYLSAEAWVSTHHGLYSYKSDGVMQAFVFPGFGADTGGLPGDPPDDLKHEESQSNQALLKQTATVKPLRLFVYVYEHAPLAKWLKAIGETKQVLMPEHLADGSLGASLRCQEHVQLKILPACTQRQWDREMMHCDLLFVRGEDSWVQAMRSGKPWLWQPYPQALDTLNSKLSALIEKMSEVLSRLEGWHWWREALYAWGMGQAQPPETFSLLCEGRAIWQALAQTWSEHCNALPRLDRTLCHMIDKRFGRPSVYT